MMACFYVSLSKRNSQLSSSDPQIRSNIIVVLNNNNKTEKESKQKQERESTEAARVTPGVERGSVLRERDTGMAAANTLGGTALKRKSHHRSKLNNFSISVLAPNTDKLSPPKIIHNQHKSSEVANAPVKVSLGLLLRSHCHHWVFSGNILLNGAENTLPLHCVWKSAEVPAQGWTKLNAKLDQQLFRQYKLRHFTVLDAAHSLQADLFTAVTANNAIVRGAWAPADLRLWSQRVTGYLVEEREQRHCKRGVGSGRFAALVTTGYEITGRGARPGKPNRPLLQFTAPVTTDHEITGRGARPGKPHRPLLQFTAPVTTDHEITGRGARPGKPNRPCRLSSTKAPSVCGSGHNRSRDNWERSETRETQPSVLLQFAAPVTTDHEITGRGARPGKPNRPGRLRSMKAPLLCGSGHNGLRDNWERSETRETQPLLQFTAPVTTDHEITGRGARPGNPTVRVDSAVRRLLQFAAPVTTDHEITGRGARPGKPNRPGRLSSTKAPSVYGSGHYGSRDNWERSETRETQPSAPSVYGSGHNRSRDNWERSETRETQPSGLLQFTAPVTTDHEITGRGARPGKPNRPGRLSSTKSPSVYGSGHNRSRDNWERSETREPTVRVDSAVRRLLHLRLRSQRSRDDWERSETRETQPSVKTQQYEGSFSLRLRLLQFAAPVTTDHEITGRGARPGKPNRPGRLSSTKAPSVYGSVYGSGHNGSRDNWERSETRETQPSVKTQQYEGSFSLRLRLLQFTAPVTTDHEITGRGARPGKPNRPGRLSSTKAPSVCGSGHNGSRDDWERSETRETQPSFTAPVTTDHEITGRGARPGKPNRPGRLSSTKAPSVCGSGHNGSRDDWERSETRETPPSV
ncbi:hypothetical protein J6590_007642 [Homalodisca vitripennis]|nr:hypothetical protein J6590_007642 [Homalodisca vitripennis]